MTTSLLANLTDQQAEQIALQSLLESVCTNALDCANSLMEVSFTYAKPNLAGKPDADDTNATDPTTEVVIAPYIPRRAKLVSASYTSSTATGLATGATTANATLTVFARPGLTGVTSTSTLAALQTLTGATGASNWAQWTPVQLNVNAFDPTNTFCPAGGALTFSITKGAVGVVVPGGRLQVRIQYV